MIYLAIFVLLSTLALMHDFFYVKKGRALSYLLAYLVLVCLSGFRYKVGGDTYNYMLVHEYLPKLTELFSTDVGIEKLQPMWIILSAAAKSINEEFYVLQILHAIIVNTVIFKFIEKNTRYRQTAILFYYFSLYPYFNFEILRESLAISCFLAATGFYKQNRWAPYYLICALAFSFHFSAIILFFLPLLKTINPKLYLLPVIFTAAALLNPLATELIQSSVVTSLLGFYAGYTDYQYSMWGLLSLLLFNLLFPLFITYVAKNTLNIPCDYYNIVNKGLIFASLTPLLFIFSRFSNYFSVFFVLLSTEILHSVFRISRNHHAAALSAPVVFFVLFGLFTFRYFADTSRLVASTRWYSYWYPYYSIFDPAEDATRERLIDAMNANLR